MMNLIFFVHKESGETGQAFIRIVRQHFNTHETQTLQSFNALKARLKLIADYNKEIFIIFADSKNRLDKLTSLIDLLENKRLILVLPDKSKLTSSKAHQFFPRYFTYIDETYTDLCAVLNKMTSKENKKDH